MPKHTALARSKGEAEPRAGTPRVVNLPLQLRAAEIVSAPESGRSFTVCFSTGAPVRRKEWVDWDRCETYSEVLEVSERAMRLDRLRNGGPLLANHNVYDLGALVGVVERAWVEGGKAYAQVRMPEPGTDAAADTLFAKVEQRILRSVSVGYAVHRMVITRENNEEVRTAVDWEPYELSLVSTPADAGAQVRSASDAARNMSCVVELKATAWLNPKENEAMSDETVAAAVTNAAGDETRAAPAAEQTRASVDQAVRAERARALEIRALAVRHAVPDLGETLVEQGVSVDTARGRILDALADAGGLPLNRAVASQIRHNDAPDQVIQRMVDGVAGALQQRAGLRVEIAPEARAYAGHDLLRFAQDFLRARGERVPHGMDRFSLFETIARSLTASDFAFTLGAVANKMLLPRYEAAASTFKTIFAYRPFTDFKPHNFVRVGDFPVPLLADEAGEYKVGAMSESRNQAVLAGYGRIVNISRRALINDDLNAFGDIGGAAAQRISAWENALAWGFLTSANGAGPTVFDPRINSGNGRTLFHADHGNLASPGTVIDIANVGLARAAMMKQTSMDGVLLNVLPKYLVTGPDRLTAAQQFCAVPIVAGTDAAANPFKGLLDPIGDGNLTGNAWYLFADPQAVPSLIWGTLGGQPAPRFEFETPFKTDGVSFKLARDLGFGVIDFRGAYRNPGA